jgi:hypothetical protein
MVSSPSSQTRTGLGWLICQTAVAVRLPTASSNDEEHLSSARKSLLTIVPWGITADEYRDDIRSVYTPIIDKIEALVKRQTEAIQSKYGQKATVSSP